MYQPLCGLASGLSPPGGATVNGVFIPDGVEVVVGNYAMMRRTDFFGPDADTFKPERWIENDAATVEKKVNIWDLLFGTGRSSCLGKNIALMELGKAIFELLRSYDLSIVDPFKAMFTKCNSVCIQKNMILRAYLRKANK